MRGIVFSVIAAGSALALPTANRVVHEKRDIPVPYPRARLPDNALVPIRIALRQNNLAFGHEYLMDVSHPSSPNYGKHWTAEDVHNHFAPSDESVQAVKDWLLGFGIDESDVRHYENKGWLAVDLPVSKAEALLDTGRYQRVTSDIFANYSDLRVGRILRV